MVAPPIVPIPHISPRSVKPFAEVPNDGAAEDPEAGAAHASPGVVRISVKDSGAGLAPKDIEKLFNEGVQINANKLQGGGGSGFGLFITKGIVAQHTGGRIWCESKGEGHGCTFVIELPAVDVAKLSPEEARWVNATGNPRASVFNSVVNTPVPSGKFNSLVDSSLPSERGSRSLRAAASTAAVESNAPVTHVLSPHAQVVGEASAVLAARAGAGSPPLCTLPPNLHVLVVDDSDMNRKVNTPGTCAGYRPAHHAPARHLAPPPCRQMVTRLLKREGHSVAEAADGVAAVSMVSRTLRGPARVTPAGPHEAPHDVVVFAGGLAGGEGAEQVRGVL
jgi:CheY-like chemotaxis protein